MFSHETQTIQATIKNGSIPKITFYPSIVKFDDICYRYLNIKIGQSRIENM